MQAVELKGVKLNFSFEIETLKVDIDEKEMNPELKFFIASVPLIAKFAEELKKKHENKDAEPEQKENELDKKEQTFSVKTNGTHTQDYKSKF